MADLEVVPSVVAVLVASPLALADLEADPLVGVDPACLAVPSAVADPAYLVVPLVVVSFVVYERYAVG